MPQEDLDGFVKTIMDAKHVFITAAGTAYYAALAGKFQITKFGGPYIEAILCSEFVDALPNIPNDSVVIAVSQSGETADTIEAIRYAREKHGAKICSIVNVVGSSLTRYSDEVIITTAGPEIAVASQKAYCTQVSALTLIALRIAELKGTFSIEEIDFLKNMLFAGGMSGEPPFSGWYADLFYMADDAALGDYIVADVHTQPTDRFGAEIGRVLHVGVGKINLGVFLADSPSDNYKPMCFVGPVMSYYEKITENFDRLTDERWTDFVVDQNLPDRPDWVNIYLADKSGNAMEKGRELPGTIYTRTENQQELLPTEFSISQNYPNPFNPSTTVRYLLPRAEKVTVAIYYMLGRKIETLVNKNQFPGKHAIQWNAFNLPSGLYFCKIQAGEFEQTIKMMLVR